MSMVIARNRFRMFTAFIADDGRRILNIADIVDGRQQSVSIEFDESDESDEVALSAEDGKVIERLLTSGRRLTTALPTPSVSEPVMTLFARAA